MKVAYIPWSNPYNIHAASGTPYYLRKMLQNIFPTQVTDLNQITPKEPDRKSLPRRLLKAYHDERLAMGIWLALKRTYYGKLTTKTYLPEFEPFLAARRAAKAERLLADIDYDIAFTFSTKITAHLKIDKPMVFWNDFTFAGYLEIFPPFAHLCRETIRHGHMIEKLTLERCSLAIYSSDWAATTAIENYAVEPEKVKVVPFGANIDCHRNYQDIKALATRKRTDICKLFFLGIDWQRKGLDKAISVALELNQRGLKTELHVGGCTPSLALPGFVKSYGFISKQSRHGRELLDRLFTQSHFFILPSRSECFGIVFAEASSFGLPSLASRVGGIPTAVKDGRNGITFEPDDNVAKYCDYIESLMRDKSRYIDLSLSSFNEYRSRLNWTTAGKQVAEYLAQL